VIYNVQSINQSTNETSARKTYLQQPHIQTFENVNVVILSIGGSDGRFQNAVQIVQIQVACWLG
jgi:hypothetical protein